MVTYSRSKLFESSIFYKPFHFPWAVDLDDEHEKMHWLPEEVPLGDDVTDWKNGKMTDDDKAFVTTILKMFTQQDVSVGDYYYRQLIPAFLNNEITCMFGGFAAREKTHQRAYALLNDTLGLPDSDYAAFLSYKEMRDKFEFMTDANTSTPEGLALALAKGVINEGLSLFASFVMLLNFQRFGKMKGMSKIVEWSIKDETKHVEGVSMVFHAVCEAYPHIVTDSLKRMIYDMVREGVRLEDAFIDLAYQNYKIEGLTAQEVKVYIRFIADRRLTQLGLKPNFMIDVNPLPWLDWVINAADHTNFFENKAAEYEVAGLVGDSWGYPDEVKEVKLFAGPLIVFTKDGCPYCKKAKDLLSLLEVPFRVMDLSHDETRHDWYDAMGFEGTQRTMPKIYVDNRGVMQLIGGYDDLRRHFNL